MRFSQAVGTILIVLFAYALLDPTGLKEWLSILFN